MVEYVDRKEDPLIQTVKTRQLITNSQTDKQNKYQDVSNEIRAMWKQNTAQVIPTVISSKGVIPKSLTQSLKRLRLASKYI